MIGSFFRVPAEHTIIVVALERYILFYQIGSDSLLVCLQ
jgi:hypothetical protein